MSLLYVKFRSIMKLKILLLFLLFTFLFLYNKSYSFEGYTYTGIASWYGKKFHGNKTASGMVFNMHALTAAHKSLPFGTIVKVLNLKNGRVVIVKIIDRGPFAKRRIIDLSHAAAKAIGLIKKGIAKVKIEVISVPSHNRMNS